MVVLAVYRCDDAARDITGCSVTFAADLPALRDAIQRFGRVTTSRSLSADDHGLKSWSSEHHRCSRSTDNEVLLLLQSILTWLPPPRGTRIGIEQVCLLVGLKVKAVYSASSC